MLLFLDESGTDHTVMPYEVLGGVAIQTRDLWNYVQAVNDAQRHCFGGLVRELAPKWEIKGSNILAKDKFKQAAQKPPFSEDDRRALACSFLTNTNAQQQPTRDEFTAFGQACWAYVQELLDTAIRFDLKVFAAMVDPAAPLPASGDHLRRDYAFLFERYYYYLEEQSDDLRGLIVFDELERSQCRKLLGRLDGYFLHTQTGRERSGRIIPEPFFVHSDLTTGTQTADIVIYVLNWAYRWGPMAGNTRPELAPLVPKIRTMIYRTQRSDQAGQQWDVWGVFYLDDLRPSSERP